MSSRQRPLTSKPFDHVEIVHFEPDEDEDAIEEKMEKEKAKTKVSDDEPLTLKEFRRLSQKQSQSKSENKQPRDLVLTFGFRCYKKYDARRKQEMFKGEFYIESVPPQIESV